MAFETSGLQQVRFELSELEKRLHHGTAELSESIRSLQRLEPRELLGIYHALAEVAMEGSALFPVSGGKIEFAAGTGSLLRPRDLDRIEACIPSVGRLEVWEGDSRSHIAGTAWMAGPDLVVTNRHVYTRSLKEAFALAGFDPTVRVVFDPSIEKNPTWEISFDIDDVVHVTSAARGEPDLAILRLKGRESRIPRLQVATPVDGMDIAVIGHPIYADREDTLAILASIDGGKRVSFGKIKQIESDLVFHSATTHPGSSGSPVIEVATGRVVGLHIDGDFGKLNFAVPGNLLGEALSGVL